MWIIGVSTLQSEGFPGSEPHVPLCAWPDDLGGHWCTVGLSELTRPNVSVVTLVCIHVILILSRALG